VALIPVVAGPEIQALPLVGINHLSTNWGLSSLARGEKCGGDLGEGEVFGGAVGALLPVQEELAVAVGEAGRGVDAEFREGLVDPGGWAFELGVVADRGLVDHQMRGDFGVDADGVRPLRAVLLVGESRNVSKLKKYLGEGFALGDDGFCLDADLVASGVDGGLLVGLAFVRDGTERAVLADAEDLPARAEVAIGSVVEGVVFEGARSDEVEA
jgi:hypothetical protein